jgi:hypothetical protein
MVLMEKVRLTFAIACQRARSNRPELIELVHHVIERHEMPPEEMEQPTKEARQTGDGVNFMIYWLKKHGRLSLHASNRFVG